MAKPKKQPSLEELRKIWYKKLKRSGFEDIEINDYDIKNPGYKYSHMDRRGQFTMDQARIYWAAKHEYYYLANQFLHQYAFTSIRERNIWEYHSNGVSIREIVTILNKLPSRKKTNRDTIWKTIRNLSKIMKEMYLKK